MSEPRKWTLCSGYSTDHDAMKWFVSRDSEITPEVENSERVKVIEHCAYQKAIEALKRECCCTGETGHVAPHKKILCDACETLRELGELNERRM